jgi:hypothetical protein
MARKRNILPAIAILCVAGLPRVDTRADVHEITRETQRVDHSHGTLRLIWWIPTDFWRESFKASAKLTPAQADGCCKVLDAYTVVAVAEMNVGSFGGLSPTPRDQLLAKLSVRVDQGDALTPVDDADLTPDAKNLLDMMKPAMSNMLGQFGKGLEFVFFPGKDAAGAKLADPRRAGLVTIAVGDDVQRFRLPLGSLLPPKFDPQTGEQFIGNYVFNPFTGAKLVDAPPAGKP